MKTKLKYLLMVVAVVPFFMSCGEDPSVGGATITFDQKTEPVTFNEKGELAITGKVVSDEGTTIESISVVCEYEKDGQKMSASVAEMKDLTKKSNNEYEFRFDEKSKGIKDHLTDIVSIKITAMVKSGDKSEKAIKITAMGSSTETPLAKAEAFAWERAGGAAATGLDSFGLQWTSNLDGFAIVKTKDAKKLVKLAEGDWAIETQEALAAAIDAATGITEYKGVSTAKSDTYNDVLGVELASGGYVVINVTKGTVSTSTAGTTIKIEGQFKK